MKAFYIPNGPKNLITSFPAILFSKIAEYYIVVRDTSNNIMATSTINNVEKANCCDDNVRIHYVNYNSAIDAVNFSLTSNEHETKSSIFTKPTPSPFIRSRHAISRTGIKASDTLTLSNIEYSEVDQKWLNELVDSPLALMQWKGIQGQPDDYIPVIILDTKMLVYKSEDRFTYELIIQVKLSHERYIIRN